MGNKCFLSIFAFKRKKEINGVKITTVDIKNPVFVAVVYISDRAQKIKAAAVNADAIR
jgi:hypothetical protein